MAIGLNTKLYVGKGSSLADAVFTEADRIAHLTSVGEQKITTDEIETTDLDCVDGFKTFEPTMSDNGSFPISGYVNGSNYSKLKALTNRDENGEYPVVPFALYHPVVSDINCKFMGWLSDIGRGELTPNGLVSFSATVRVSGNVEDFAGVTE